MSTSDLVATLVAPHEPPCLSLYQTAASLHPEQKKDRIVFRKLVDAMAVRLKQDYPDRVIEPLLEPFRALGEDATFWSRVSPGLAAFRAGDLFRVERLPRPVPELSVVADTFHLKPLLRIVQSADRFQILGVSRTTACLFEGDRHGVEALVPDPAVPRTLEEALGSELTPPHRGVYSYGMGPRSAPGMHHGQGAKKDEVDVDTERFFRAVDRAVLDKHSRPSGLPLLLLALPEYHTWFRQVSANPFLLPDGIDADPDALSPPELRERAWRVMEPRYRDRLASLSEAFGTAQAHGRGASDLADIAAAAVQSRVGTLLVEADRHMPGRLDPTMGTVTFARGPEGSGDDLLDDLAELVLRRGGEVVVVPAVSMPAASGVAAIYRF